MVRCPRLIYLIWLPILVGLTITGTSQLKAGGFEDPLSQSAVSGSKGQIKERELPAQERLEQPLAQGTPEFSPQTGIRNRLNYPSKISKSAGTQQKKNSSRLDSESEPAQEAWRRATPGSSRGPLPAPYRPSPAPKDSARPSYGGSGS